MGLLSVASAEQKSFMTCHVINIHQLPTSHHIPCYCYVVVIHVTEINQFKLITVLLHLGVKDIIFQTVVGSCEHGNEYGSPAKCGIVDQLSNYQFLKKRLCSMESHEFIKYTIFLCCGPIYKNITVIFKPKVQQVELLNYDELRENFCDNFCVGTNSTFHRNLFSDFQR